MFISAQAAPPLDCGFLAYQRPAADLDHLRTLATFGEPIKQSARDTVRAAKLGNGKHQLHVVSFVAASMRHGWNRVGVGRNGVIASVTSFGLAFPQWENRVVLPANKKPPTTLLGGRVGGFLK